MAEKNLNIKEGKNVSDKKKFLIFLDITVTNFATSMLATALTTAIPPIMKDLSVDVNKAQWLTTAFSLFLAIITPFTGYLISKHKTKNLYMFALSFFIIGLLICSFSSNFWLMLVGRVIQGGGNGLISSMSQVVLINIFPPNKIGSIMGWYGLSLSVAPIISPTVAGVLVDRLSWRYIFILPAVVMVASLIIAFFVFENVLPTMKKKFDVISFTISAFTFGGITLAISNLGIFKFVSYQVLVPLIIGLVASVLFIWRQLRIKVPFLDLRVLKYKEYTVGAVSSFILQLIIMGSAMIIPLYVQQVKYKSATISGLVVLPGALSNTIINPLAGKIYDKVGMKVLFIVGSVLLTLSNLAIFFIRVHHHVIIVSVINVFRCIAMGVLVMPFYTWSMKQIPKIKTSDATALFNSIRFVGCAFGTALFVSVMTKATELAPKNHESPQMFGINIAFLAMAICSFIILLFGIFGCKRTPKKSEPATPETTEDAAKAKSNENGKLKDSKETLVDTEDITIKETSDDVDITIKENENEEATARDNNESVELIVK